jgi:hypothetical protein
MRPLTISGLLFAAALGTAAPALGEKPARWEYAELTFRTTPARPAGVDGDGNEVAAVPAAMTIRWINKDGEIEVKGWVELAEKLKAPGYKKDGSVAFQKIQFLNYLGSEGWELMEHAGSTTANPFTAAGALGGARGVGGDRTGRSPISPTTWMLKRKLP